MMIGNIYAWILLYIRLLPIDRQGDSSEFKFENFPRTNSSNIIIMTLIPAHQLRFFFFFMNLMFQMILLFIQRDAFVVCPTYRAYYGSCFLINLEIIAEKLSYFGSITSLKRRKAKPARTTPIRLKLFVYPGQCFLTLSILSTFTFFQLHWHTLQIKLSTTDY